jgi:UDP-3-O-[3-hydroxymyristoyl] glucosamine N-acyltransferase
MVFHGRKDGPVTLTVNQIAKLVQGTVQGDGNVAIRAARPLNEAQAGDITFVADSRHIARLHNTRASAAVVPMTAPANGLPIIQVKDPLNAFVTIVRHMRGSVVEKPHGIDPRAYVHESAVIGADASVHPFASIGAGAVIGARCRIHSGVSIGTQCKLGDDVTLFPHVVLYDATIVGNRVIIHANSVIGADGFGYRFEGGKHVKVPQLGYVEIGDDVEIGACTTVDRGTFEATRIGEGTKIDNLAQIAHNCQIGKHNLLISQMGIAGSSSTGDFVVVAGQVGICDHVHIGAGAIIGAKAGVTKDVPAGQRMLGAPATPERDQKRIMMSLPRLPEINKELRRIRQHVGLAEDA